MTDTDLSQLSRIVSDMIEDLRVNGKTPGIDVGEAAPRFTLPDAGGQALSLDDRLADGPVVLVFYRGDWCPYCHLHLTDIQASLEEITERGASLVAVTPQAPDNALTLSERLELGFDVVSDLDRSVMDAYRLRFELPTELRVLYEELGIDLGVQNADGSWTLPVPATFVLDSTGVVRARHVDPNYLERMSGADIVAALQDLSDVEG